MKPETKLKKKIVKALREIPHTDWHVIDQSSIRGDPDIMGCVAGLFFGIEVKNKFETTFSDREKLQRWKLARIMNAGGAGLIITEETWKFHVRRIQRVVEERLRLGLFVPSWRPISSTSFDAPSMKR